MKRKAVHRYLFLLIALVLLVCCGCGRKSDAQDVSFPTKPIKIIVPFSPGGGLDTTARIMADALAKELPQSIVVENMPGARGVTGWTECYNADPDGYTLAVTNLGMAFQALSGDVGYEYDKFTYLMECTQDTYIMVVSADSGISSMEDFLAYARDHRVVFAESGVSVHYANIDFVDQAGLTDFAFVPFDSASETVPPILSGDCTAGAVSVSICKSMIEAGKLTPLFAMSAERVDVFPDVPTSDEVGFTNLHYGASRGFIAPPGTPQEVCDIITAAMYRAVEQDSYKEAEANLGLTRSILPGDSLKKELDEVYVSAVRLKTLEESWDSKTS